jgi:hypothetical protein
MYASVVVVDWEVVGLAPALTDTMRDIQEKLLSTTFEGRIQLFISCRPEVGFSKVLHQVG